MSPSTNERHELEILLVSKGSSSPINLLLTDSALVVTRRKSGLSTLKINKASSSSIKVFPFLQVLSARATRRSPDAPSAQVIVSAIYSTSEKAPAKLWTVQGDVFEAEHDRERRLDGHCRVEQWCDELMRRAYQGDVKPGRRLRVIINKHGGKGQAQSIWQTTVAPIFEAAGCSATVEYTGPASSPQNARNLGRSHKYEAFDALVPVSGDGITHELLNGLASRPDALKALRSTVIAPIPAGSGNALQINLEGPKRANDCAWAALAVIKGTAVPLDLCSVSQGGKRSYSFLSQAFGLMADLDLGTEHMRWMGDARFIVGFLQGALTKRTYPVELSLKIVEGGSDKSSLAKAHNASLQDRKSVPLEQPSSGVEQHMPELRFGTEDAPLPSTSVTDELPLNLAPGWHTLKTRVSYVYGGKMPFVSQDAMLFPPASADNGLIDLTVMAPSSRMDALSGLDGAAEGKVFFNKNVRYYRCEAYRLTPLASKGYISIDGEEVPFSPFQVEVHRGLARCFALNGRWHSTPISIE